MHFNVRNTNLVEYLLEAPGEIWTASCQTHTSTHSSELVGMNSTQH